MSLVRQERFLILGMVLAVPAFPLEHAILAVGQTASLIATVALIGAIITGALADRMQPAVNIALGASLSTFILTVPVMELIALFTHTPVHMALTPVQTVMIGVTLVVAGINLHDGETNAFEGATHFVLFATFLMLAVLGL